MIAAFVPYLIAAAMAFGAGWSINGWRLDAELAQVKQAQAESISKGVSDALKVTVDLQRRKDAAIGEAQNRNRALAAGADAARAESVRLRDDLSRARADAAKATRDSLDRYTATLGVVFDQCADAYQELARSADGHASDSLTLKMSWPR